MWCSWVTVLSNLSTHHARSSSPPWQATADFTLLANWTASSPSWKHIAVMLAVITWLSPSVCERVYASVTLLLKAQMASSTAFNSSSSSAELSSPSSPSIKRDAGERWWWCSGVTVSPSWHSEADAAPIRWEWELQHGQIPENQRKALKPSDVRPSGSPD